MQQALINYILGNHTQIPNALKAEEYFLSLRWIESLSENELDTDMKNCILKQFRDLYEEKYKPYRDLCPNLL